MEVPPSEHNYTNPVCQKLYLTLNKQQKQQNASQHAREL